MPIVIIFLNQLIICVVFLKKKSGCKHKKKALVIIYRKKVSLAGSNVSIKVYKK